MEQEQNIHLLKLKDLEMIVIIHQEMTIIMIAIEYFMENI